jgi:cellulose synthase/poly-beta-1,6-N-acetylglucosamine synthase-like glycosyltransferase
MATMDSIGGFDRELEYKLIESNNSVYYAKDIVMFDEKVDNPEVFQRQRTRWISSQFFYLRTYFAKGVSALFKGNFNYFNATVLRNVQLPRLLNLGLLGFITLLSAVAFFYTEVNVHPLVWIGLLLLNIIAMMFAIPAKSYNAQLIKSILLVPVIFFKMMFLMFKLKGANKTFIHTPHGQVANSKNV